MLEFLNHDDDESAIEQLAQEVETNSSRVAKLLLLRSCLPIQERLLSGQGMMIILGHHLRCECYYVDWDMLQQNHQI